MLEILYEDQDIIVVVKPSGVESQAARKFQPDMISAIKKHLVINKLCTPGKEPYVAVIHRLDNPVSGIMVYAKTKKAAAVLSEQVQKQDIEKTYMAVLCGKPVHNVDNYVDYLVKSVDENTSHVVEKGISGAKRAELSYEVVETVQMHEPAQGQKESLELTLVKIRLLTGRHHQIRVQFASRGTPLYGDRRYQPEIVCGEQHGLALCAVSLAFQHPVTKKRMSFSIKPSGGVFEKFLTVHNMEKSAHTI